MPPRRSRKRPSWLDRFGAIAKPESIAACVIVFGTWAENRHHTNKSTGELEDWRKFATAQRVASDNRADSLSARIASLERQVRRLGARKRYRMSRADSVFYGPPAPPTKGTLLSSLGRAFRGIFGG